MKLTNNGGKWTIESDLSVNVSRSTINSEMLSKLVEIDASDNIISAIFCELYPDTMIMLMKEGIDN